MFDLDAATQAELTAQAIVERAKHLGLTWGMRMATVDDGSVPNAVLATYDGDTTSIGMVSMIGLLAGGERVYVIQVPPSGNFIVGSSPAPGVVDFVSSASNTAAIGAEAIVLTSNSVTWKAGRAYSVSFYQASRPSVAGNYAYFRVRRNALAGTLKLDLMVSQLPNVFDTGCYHSGRVRNLTTADITDTVVVTMTAGAGTVTGLGSANVLRWLEIADIGAAATFSNAAQI